MTDSADLLETLVGIVGADNVLTAPEDVSRFCADWRGRYTKSKAMDNAVGRMIDEERRSEDRKEQSDNDEHGQRKR